MEIILSQSAERQFSHLPKTAQKKVLKSLRSLRTNPLLGKKLNGQLEGIFSVRAWPYRILYSIDTLGKKIIIHKIAHRQGAYQ